MSRIDRPRVGAGKGISPPRRGPEGAFGAARLRRAPTRLVGATPFPALPRGAQSSGPPRFYRLVYRLVRRVPRGRVVTYGQVAAILGQPRGARAVGMALGMLRGPLLESVPWQRVINASGRCSHRDGFWAGVQQEMLEHEGIRFDRHGRVDLKSMRWKGPRREWITRLRCEIP